MNIIRPIEPSLTEGKTRRLLDAVKNQLGTVPNLFKGIANSPAALESYLGQVKALAGGVIGPGLREQIAVAVAGINHCNYCASAHTALGKGTGLTDDELSLNLVGRSQDGQTQAALVFARKIVENRGQLSPAELQAVHDAGFSEAQIVEIIAHVALNIFTNYFNLIAETKVDFPLIDTAMLASAA